MSKSRSTAFVLVRVGIIVNLCLLSVFTESFVNHQRPFSAVTIASVDREFRAHGLVTPSSNKPSSPALRSHPQKQHGLILFGATCAGAAQSTHPFNFTTDSSGSGFTSADEFAQPDTRAPPTI